jgi:hypothetical protein
MRSYTVWCLVSGVCFGQVYAPVYLIPSVLFGWAKWAKDPASAGARLVSNLLGSMAFLSSYQTIVKATQTVMHEGLLQDAPWQVGAGTWAWAWAWAGALRCGARGGCGEMGSYSTGLPTDCTRRDCNPTPHTFRPWSAVSRPGSRACSSGLGASTTSCCTACRTPPWLSSRFSSAGQTARAQRR